MKEETRIKKSCEKAGIECEKKSEHHWHLKGKLLVNYYPSKGTAYVAGTNGGVKATLAQAIAMTGAQPDSLDKTARIRKDWHKLAKAQMFAKSNKCCWCGCEMTMTQKLPNSATLEHVIPLSIGGLDNRNNMKLACRACNETRGNVMVELES